MALENAANTSKVKIIFERVFRALEKTRRIMTKIINVGNPLNLKLESRAEEKRRIYVEDFKVLTRLRTTRNNRNPETIGISCQSVIPIAPTNGVAHIIPEAICAVRILK